MGIIFDWEGGLNVKKETTLQRARGRELEAQK